MCATATEISSPTRDAEAAKRFFVKALPSTAGSAPRARPVEEPTAAAYPKAIADLKASGVLPESVELRQVKYLNNLVEQDHRFIQHFVNDWSNQGLGFFSMETAGRTLQGYEVMSMIRKGQMRG